MKTEKTPRHRPRLWLAGTVLTAVTAVATALFSITANGSQEPASPWMSVAAPYVNRAAQSDPCDEERFGGLAGAQIATGARQGRTSR